MAPGLNEGSLPCLESRLSSIWKRGNCLTTRCTRKYVMSAESKRQNSRTRTVMTWLPGGKHTNQPVTKTHVSSNAMEAQGAKEMWTRSVEQNRMQYTTFVGDGDSKAYKTVCEEKPYGEVEILKGRLHWACTEENGV